MTPGWFQFLFIDNFGSIITVLVGLFAFVTYYLAQRDTIQSAASIVMLEVRRAEQFSDEIREAVANNNVIDIVPSNVSMQSWQRYRHVLAKRLDNDEQKEIQSFFENVTSIAEVLRDFHALHLASLTNKTTDMQKQLIVFAAAAAGNQQKYEQMRDELTSITHQESYWFEPNMFKNQFSKLVPLVKKISTTSTGMKLKQIQLGQFFWL